MREEKPECPEKSHASQRRNMATAYRKARVKMHSKILRSFNCHQACVQHRTGAVSAPQSIWSVESATVNWCVLCFLLTRDQKKHLIITHLIHFKITLCFSSLSICVRVWVWFRVSAVSRVLLPFRLARQYFYDQRTLIRFFCNECHVFERFTVCDIWQAGHWVSMSADSLATCASH